MGDVAIEVGADKVAVVEIQRGPNNFFSYGLIQEIAGAFEELQQGDDARAIVLCSEGKHFCAGADFSDPNRGNEPHGGLYLEATRLFATELPVVAAVQGAAIGGGLGLALMPDFRIATPEARFAANFARLGFHQGFGLSVTLPRLVGHQAAAEMLYTGRRVKGEEAVEIGLAHRLATMDTVRDVAHELAVEIAKSAPMAVRSIRKTLRWGLADEIRRATDHELVEQTRLRESNDFREGTAAVAERRDGNFTNS
ncbi:MAG: enoyl-CoA hydratase/isomerase family protein [Actinomycetota bacterium]